MEIIKPLDDLLENQCFAGCELIGVVAFGLGFGAEKRNEIIKGMRDYYDNLSFVNNDGNLNLTPSPCYQKEFLRKCGFDEKSKKIQYLGQITIYPTEYFCPKSYVTYQTVITPNTYSIHHFDGSWLPEEQRYRMKLSFKLNFLPKKDLVISFIVLLKFKGWKVAFGKVWQWVKKKVKLR